MAFDLHLSIPEDSPAHDIVRRVAADARITPEQAAERLLTEAARVRTAKSPAEEMWGAFSTPEDAAMLDEVVAGAYSRRSADLPRDFGL